ncbi:hypothetical protein GIX45_15835 [Erwinia sp. CPCC 100877]|nr:hypothetical protein [Erwinia sp. CPCC 100877]
MTNIQKFLQAEINKQELYEGIVEIIDSYEIRSGEFEGNEYIIKKLDRLNFLIFPEYEVSGQKEIPFATSYYKNNLLKGIHERAKQKGLQLY